jgi:thiol:disulfide interchange protein DsbD
MKFYQLIYFIFTVCFITPFANAEATTSSTDSFLQEDEFLPGDEAFKFEFHQQGQKLILNWQIAEGYYLYKKQFRIKSANAIVKNPTFSPSKIKEDEFFGKSEVFYQQANVEYTIVNSTAGDEISIRYQGCAEAGLCYPPTTKVIQLTNVSSETGLTSALEPAPVSEQFELANMLNSDGSMAITLLLFLALGIGLAFTPCVFPMYPILSGIVIGQGKQISTKRAFMLSFVYVQGMALTYSLLGLIVAIAGVKFQIALQHPIILITLIVVFALLAFVMFGAYELQLPSKWQEKLNSLSNDQKSGSYFGVLLMGAISGLVASPCTTAPLTGILLYIAQSGDMMLGFSALYALSLGMGILLILFGITGGKLLPKAGNWMNIVKVTFGFMMLSVGMMFVERLVVNIWTELAWSVLGLATFTYFYVMNQNSSITFFKGVRTLVILLGFFASAMYGYNQVFDNSAQVIHTEQSSSFVEVTNISDFKKQLAKANADGKTVMIDLYADWCVACKEFEKYTFHDPKVQQALENTVMMQINLSDDSKENLLFWKEYDVLGLPTILFFDKAGTELTQSRVTGFMKALPFASHVNQSLKTH